MVLCVGAADGVWAFCSRQPPITHGQFVVVAAGDKQADIAVVSLAPGAEKSQVRRERHRSRQQSP